mgnify:CR=1 FL=1
MINNYDGVGQAEKIVGSIDKLITAMGEREGSSMGGCGGLGAWAQPTSVRTGLSAPKHTPAAFDTPRTGGAHGDARRCAN